jgi:hypothetical protein
LHLQIKKRTLTPENQKTKVFSSFFFEFHSFKSVLEQPKEKKKVLTAQNIEPCPKLILIINRQKLHVHTMHSKLKSKKEETKEI